MIDPTPAIKNIVFFRPPLLPLRDLMPARLYIVQVIRGFHNLYTGYPHK
jgi:hypothetical protein